MITNRELLELQKAHKRVNEYLPSIERLNEQLSSIKVRTMPQLRIPKLDIAKINPAKSAYNRLLEYIKDFEKNLDEEHEVGARLVSFGTTHTFHIQNLDYYGPDIITFYGKTDKGDEVQLIQNISQLNVLLIAMKKLEEKPKRIGFHVKLGN